MAQTAHSFEYTATKKERLNFLLSLPPDYDENPTQQHPLILFLHGLGESGGEGISLDVVKKHGLPKRVERKHTLPFIVVSPQCPRDTWWSDHTAALMGLLDKVIESYRVDKQRVYLTGLSMGGYGTWHLASIFPKRFAAIAPICGGMPWFVRLEEAARRMKDLPVWAFHGAKDEAVPLKESERVVEALKIAGNNVKFTVYPELEHDSWTETYANPKLYKWLLQHRLTETR
jgi:predicted peptidase